MTQRGKRWLVALALCLPIGSYVWWVRAQNALANQLQVEIARLRDLGIATTDEEWTAMANRPGAFARYLRYLGRLNAIPHPKLTFTKVGQEFAPDHWAALEERIQKSDLAMESVASLSQQPYRPGKPTPSQNGVVGIFFNECDWRVQLATHRRDWKSGLKWLTVSARLWKDLADDATYGELNAIHLRKKRQFQLVNLLRRCGSTPERIGQARAVLATLGRADWKKELSSIESRQRELFASFAANRVPWENDPCTGVDTGTRVAVQLYSSGLMRKSFDLRRLRISRILAQAVITGERSYKALKETEERVERDVYQAPKSDVSGLLFASVGNTPMSFAQWIAGNDAIDRLTLCNLALLDGGKLPTGPASIDPFSGKPFIHRRSGSDFRVYSVGRNGVDDGGYVFGKYEDDIEIHL